MRRASRKVRDVGLHDFFSVTRRRSYGAILMSISAALSIAMLMSCDRDESAGPDGEELDPALVAEGKDIYRFDTFGDEQFWTDPLRMHEVIEQAVKPAVALAGSRKVDSDALPSEIKTALAAGQVDLNSTTTTLALLKLNAVVGVKGDVQTVGGTERLVRVGITCALCHSTVDNSFAPGIGKRLDGWANTTLNPGAIIALSPALSAEQKAVYNSWGPGRYDPRFNIDGRITPLVIPPAYGLRDVPHATFTGDGDVAYWNNYVAVTQMGGQGTFVDERLNLERRLPQGTEDLVRPKLAALRDYQLSIEAPSPPSGSFDQAAAQRGRAVFEGAGRCASCHQGDRRTQEALHAPADTGSDGAYAARTATKRYRTTPLRGLWQHPPYFHDGSARTLAQVVDHYETALGLRMTPAQKSDLVEYLKSI